jgi:hypothetical protein
VLRAKSRDPADETLLGSSALTSPKRGGENMQECVTDYGEDYVYDGIETTCASPTCIREKDWFDLKLRMKNMNDLRTLQEIMRLEEDKI